MPKNHYDWPVLVNDTFDLLAAKPEGATLVEIADRLGVQDTTARIVINKMREEFGDAEDMNVVTRSDGRSRYYCLTDPSVEAEGTGWLDFNRKYVETRLATVRKVYQSLQRAAETEEESVKVRRILKSLDRLIEDVTEGV